MEICHGWRGERCVEVQIIYRIEERRAKREKTERQNKAINQ